MEGRSTFIDGAYERYYDAEVEYHQPREKGHTTPFEPLRKRVITLLGKGCERFDQNLYRLDSVVATVVVQLQRHSTPPIRDFHSDESHRHDAKPVYARQQQ